jgi:hypothetical protein
LDVSDEFLRKRSETYLDLVAKLGALERYTLLAKHCSGNLEKFLIFARNGEVALEQDRIRLEYQRILQEGDATRKEALEVLEKSLKTCAANEDPATRKKCVDAVTTLIERPGGTIELSAPTIIQSPSVRPPLPLVDYDAAKAKKSSFDFRFGKLVSGLIPTLDPAKLNTEDATKLAAPHKNLTDNQAAYLDQTKHGSAASLKSKADKAITTQMRTKVETLQKLRPALHSAVVSAAGSDALTLKAAQLALDLHDTTAKLKLREYQELHDALDAMTDKIVKHLKAVSDLEAAINTAEEKKANAASESQ